MLFRILIIGCAGFIGSHSAIRFQELGYEVIGFDNFNDHTDVSLKRSRAELLASHAIPVIEGDILDEEVLKTIFNEFKPTHVLHLAAHAGVRESWNKPEEYKEVNEIGFLKVLKTCCDHNVKLIYASSSSVYGNNQKVPFSEEDRTDDPASLYAATKISNEKDALVYHKRYGLDVTGLRFFTVYGPWGRPDMAYSKFAKAIVEGRPIDVYNHGEMKRDFTFIDDIVDGIVAAVERCCGYNIYNLGRGQPESLDLFIETLEEYFGIKAEKKLVSMQPGDVTITYADISKSQKELDYHPKISIREGLKRFVAWYKEYYSLDKQLDVSADHAAVDATVL